MSVYSRASVRSEVIPSGSGVTTLGSVFLFLSTGWVFRFHDDDFCVKLHCSNECGDRPIGSRKLRAPYVSFVSATGGGSQREGNYTSFLWFLR